MQEIKLTINGEEQTLTEEQMANIRKMFPRDELARKAKGESFYCVGMFGEHFRHIEHETECEDKIYAVGNYYPTKHIAEMRSLDWQLNNLLFRYSMQHGEEADDNCGESFVLMWDNYCNCFAIDETDDCFLTSVVFNSATVAEAAIREVVEPFCEKHPEYLDWLRGDKR